MTKPTIEKDFFTRRPLDAPNLIELFNWSEEKFLSQTEGSAIRRIGYKRWLRNISIALGNAPTSEKIVLALNKRKSEFIKQDNATLLEHINWALEQHS